MNLFKSEEERKIAQQERLINRDFPWLWAIRNQWVPGFGHITVKDMKDVADYPYTTNLQRFLGLPINWAEGRIEVWIRYRTGLTTGVKRVVVDAKVNKTGNHSCWAKAINTALRRDERILNIVIVNPKISDGNGDLVVIYREKQPGTFDSMVGHVAGTRVVVQCVDRSMQTSVTG